MKKQPTGILGETNMNTDNKNKNKYSLVCGLEIHAELKTKSKMFCGCKNDPFGAEKPNIYTCPTCLGMPGGSPVANKKAIEWTIKVGLALGCKINLFSKFDRKNYFYPDLPKAYQISQYDLPFCYDGVLETSFGPVGITRIHLEEDTGKLLHKKVNGEQVSLIDFNRSSVPLMEIVTEPDIHSPKQAKEYAKEIRKILRYLEVADCDMDQGGMRLEANISLAPTDKNNPKSKSSELPKYKVEVKNINSFKFMEQAIKYEMNRQTKILDKGEVPAQETRGWNSIKSITFSQRTKEDSEDYRYFPDPDLPPIRYSRESIEAMRAELPELPAQKTERWNTEYGVEKRYSKQLISHEMFTNLLEESFKICKLENIEPNKLASAIVNKNIIISHE
ncbi:Asp-tRNA(Asn)/Glu-tRNA(Gln) amidotransferase subunit GatB, partial [Patescibacteria group bacterium]|nr:Asp-tRNA(Asn)/Glu-tRNA(Gln) amidotransferase subunit GatB [Patescibacteria group bacterium]